MHHLQRKILHRLYEKENGKFSDLKPEIIENNVFDYHLKQLIAQKLVIKNQDGFYELSPGGLGYVDRLSGEYDQEFLQAKIITIIELLLPDGRELLYRRKHQPYLGMVGLLSGKVYLNEDIKEAASRELKEKSGLSQVKLVHRADAYISIFKENERITKVLGHVFSGTLKKEERINSSHPKGEVFWGRLSDQKDIMPGTLELKTKLKTNKDFFFAEISENIRL